MKYLQWVCPACRLKNYLGVEDYVDNRNEVQTCKFCHSISIISYSNSLVNKVQLKKCNEDAWKCSECFYSSK